MEEPPSLLQLSLDALVHGVSTGSTLVRRDGTLARAAGGSFWLSEDDQAADAQLHSLALLPIPLDVKLRVLNELRVGGVLDDARLLLLADASLTSLELSGCRQVTAEGLRALGECCPQLAAISLDWCFQLGDAHVDAIASSFSALRTLSLRGCRHLSGAAIARVVERAPALRVLDISECVRAAAELAGGARRVGGRLRELSVLGNSVLDDASQLLSLARAFPTVRVISISLPLACRSRAPSPAAAPHSRARPAEPQNDPGQALRAVLASGACARLREATLLSPRGTLRLHALLGAAEAAWHSAPPARGAPHAAPQQPGPASARVRMPLRAAAITRAGGAALHASSLRTMLSAPATSMTAVTAVRDGRARAGCAELTPVAAGSAAGAAACTAAGGAASSDSDTADSADASADLAAQHGAPYPLRALTLRCRRIDGAAAEPAAERGDGGGGGVGGAPGAVQPGGLDLPSPPLASLASAFAAVAHGARGAEPAAGACPLGRVRSLALSARRFVGAGCLQAALLALPALESLALGISVVAARPPALPAATAEAHGAGRAAAAADELLGPSDPADDSTLEANGSSDEDEDQPPVPPLRRRRRNAIWQLHSSIEAIARAPMRKRVRSCALAPLPPPVRWQHARLRALSLHRVELAPPLLESLRACVALEGLALRRCSGLTEDAAHALLSVPPNRLRVLRVSRALGARLDRLAAAAALEAHSTVGEAVTPGVLPAGEAWLSGFHEVTPATWSTLATLTRLRGVRLLRDDADGTTTSGAT